MDRQPRFSLLEYSCFAGDDRFGALGERFGYPELAQLLRRGGVAEGDRYLAHMHELFRRMVFN